MRTYTGTAWDGWKKVAVTSDIPAVNDGTLTIQKNGTDVATFTANQSTNATANITVPTSIGGLGGGTLTSPLKVTGGDGANASKISLDNSNNGQITDKSTATLLGFTDTTNFIVGHKNYGLRLRGKTNRPQYTTDNVNYKALALYSDIPTLRWVTPTSVSEIVDAIMWKVDGQTLNIHQIYGTGSGACGTVAVEEQQDNEQGAAYIYISKSTNKITVKGALYTDATTSKLVWIEETNISVTLSKWKILKHG